ncbi:MAG TPA: nodulation protein NodZ [Candidatus Binataceae bacterium]|nr:nodulation protein NodZ [Candidatus Binataceae bacterium]
MSDGRFLLVKGIAGLGNRISSALSGICYARLSGRQLFIDWSDPDYSPDGSNIFHRLFQCSSFSASDIFPQTDSVYPAIWRGRLHEPARSMGSRLGLTTDGIRRNLSIDVTRIDYAEDLLVLVAYSEQVRHMRPHFQGRFAELAKISPTEILKDMLRRDLILHPQLQERVDQFKRRHFTGPMVGVHIRYSDYRSAIIAIIRRLNRLLRRHPDLSIFVCSDSAEAIGMFRQVYPRIVTMEHWFAQPGVSLHKNVKCPDRIQAAMDALTDLYLLAQCDYLIFDWTSSFGRVADLVSRAPEDNIIRIRHGEAKELSKTQQMVTDLMRKVGFFSWGFRVLPRVVPIRWL